MPKPKWKDLLWAAGSSLPMFGGMELLRLSHRDGDQVRRRVIEYMGGEGDDARTATCGYITRCDRGEPYAPEHLHPPSSVDRFIERGHDIARSLVDHRSALLHMDVEYVNFDDPLAAFRDPLRAFEFQKPVVSAILGILERFNIHPLQILTGQGHHFVWRVEKDGRASRHLAKLGGRATAGAPGTPADESSSDAAFLGAGLAVEWLAHRALEIARPQMDIPVSLTAVSPGLIRTGRREAVSIDLSEYGDPVQTRTVRAPFTPYRKPSRWNHDSDVAAFDTLPENGHPVEELLTLRRDPCAVGELSRSCEVHIPLAETGTEDLIEAYLRSDLRRFHRHYYAAAPDPPEIWHRTYHRTPMSALPPCARALVEHPNDALLKPAGMQHLARTLIAQGWHPRHAGGMIWSIFADPRHGWGGIWRHYDPARRSDFYVRIFSGLMATGLDGLVDFNCVSSQEKLLCTQRTACEGLEGSRAALEAKLAAK